MDVVEPSAIRREAVHLAVQDRIKRFIIDHGYRPGDLLPAEAELARVLGVSRPSLREGLKALQMLGVVETRHGAGTFVGHFSFSPLVDGLTFRIRSDLDRDVRTIRDLLEIRMILENALVARVAAVAGGEHLAPLRTIVERMESAAARDAEFYDEDRLFHEQLYQPLGNALVVPLLQAFWDVLASVRAELPMTPVPLRVTAADHRRILTALESGDPAAAAAAMTAHFHGILGRIKEPLSPLPERSDAAVTSRAPGGHR